jgi:predicted dehydrogenase
MPAWPRHKVILVLRIGLLGASKISRGAVIGPARDIAGVGVSRVAARDASRARVFAQEHGIEGIEADYACLVASDVVDLVYNGLPPSGHAEWTIRALDAGKHVLCEKPFALNAGEAEEMLAAETASNAVLIEAFHHRYHPLWHRIVELVSQGAIGDIRELDARFDAPIPYRPGELRYERRLGGGAMMDLGCYPLHWVRTVTGAEPGVISAEAVWHPSGVDVSMQAELEFPGGVLARIACAMDPDQVSDFKATLRVIGSAGRMDVVNPLAPHHGHELRLEVDGEVSVEEVPGRSTYHHQLEWTLDQIAGKKPPLTGGDDSLATMRAIDAIYQAAGGA